jgi:hypothetical protein
MSLSRAGALLAVLLILPACGETHGPAGAAPPPGGGGRVDEVSFASDVWPILLVRCQVCHTTGQGALEVPDMLMSDPSTLYDSWVRVNARCNPNFFRVLAGESDLSFVFDKISHVAPLCGQRMPSDGPMLEDVEQQTIKDWIDQGAKRN